MIDPVEAVSTTHGTNQSLKAPSHPQQQATTTDTVQISEAARATLDGSIEDHAEMTIKAKCGDLEAQQLLEQQAARMELLGLPRTGG